MAILYTSHIEVWTQPPFCAGTQALVPGLEVWAEQPLSFVKQFCTCDTKRNLLRESYRRSGIYSIIIIVPKFHNITLEGSFYNVIW